MEQLILHINVIHGTGILMKLNVHTSTCYIYYTWETLTKWQPFYLSKCDTLLPSLGPDRVHDGLAGDRQKEYLIKILFDD